MVVSESLGRTQTLTGVARESSAFHTSSHFSSAETLDELHVGPFPTHRGPDSEEDLAEDIARESGASGGQRPVRAGHLR